ncbi:transfer protein spdA [Streptomyces thermodiastaticus]|uniref:transfer protein spdA n=1 Tax=Streptomyces thermodiastaticus TaxID=44061 RepID=UPI001E3A71CC|nr:transfer protein spdA [Streptomyces thermodiastaticus]MCE7552785.1 transfer protein spdA [Streptomyces thermodiastaticus]
MRLTFTDIVRYVALLAAMSISFTTQRELALTHGVPESVAFAVPLAIDLYMIWSVRSRKDIALSVAVAVAANVAGVLTTESLSAVGTWVAAGLHAVFPLTVWRMHRAESPERPSEPLPDSETDNDRTCTANGPQMAAQSLTAVADSWPPDDLWADFENTEADSAPDMPTATPPSAEDIRAAVAVLESRYGRPVTGRILADHFGVSERTGRRYLAMAA